VQNSVCHDDEVISNGTIFITSHLHTAEKRIKDIMALTAKSDSVAGIIEVSYFVLLEEIRVVHRDILRSEDVEKMGCL
jgi:hypothetical protein